MLAYGCDGVLPLWLVYGTVLLCLLYLLCVSAAVSAVENCDARMHSLRCESAGC
jgi:hypothetical protein